MPRYVAFLRAINVGGHTVKMEQLRTLFSDLGFAQVETFIASGNVLFSTPATSRLALRKKIEAQLEKSLGYEVITFLKTDVEVAAIATAKPFPANALATAGAFNVAFLHEPLDTEKEAALASFKTDIDDFKTIGTELYWLCKTKQSDSTFSNVKLEKTLKLRATFRGMNTLQKLAAKLTATN